MSEFKKPPVLVLETMEDVRKTIEIPQWRDSMGYNWPLVKSIWIISLIDEIEKTGKYPYNACVKKLAEQRLGYPPKPEAEYSREGDNLSALVYNAQCYRRSDKLIAAGYVPFTQEFIEQVGVGAKIDVGGTELTVRLINGKLYAMKKNARKYACSPQGQPVKVK